jgi:hypothetical protein
MPASRPRRFCQALLEETGGEVPRWVSITAIAGQLGLEQEEAEALGAELDELDLVRVGGGQACQRAIKKSDVLRPSRGSGTGRAKVPGGRSRC